MTEPISRAEAKLQLRADGTSIDDTLIDELVTGARAYAEEYCGIRLIVGPATMTFATFANLERLSLAPVTAVTELRYLDASGIEQVVDSSTYELLDVSADVLRPRIRLAFGKSWPAIRSAEDAVRVVATVGYAAVPAPIIRAMKLLITHWYDNRQVMAIGQHALEIPHSVTSLLANYRR